MRNIYEALIRYLLKILEFVGKYFLWLSFFIILFFIILLVVIRKRIKKRRIENKKPEITMRDYYLNQINFVEQRLVNEEPEKIHKEVVNLIRDFFSTYLNKKNFTYEELEKELNKHGKVICFSKNLSKLSYGPDGVRVEELKDLLEEFKDTVKVLT